LFADYSFRKLLVPKRSLCHNIKKEGQQQNGFGRAVAFYGFLQFSTIRIISIKEKIRFKIILKTILKISGD